MFTFFFVKKNSGLSRYWETSFGTIVFLMVASQALYSNARNPILLVSLDFFTQIGN